MTDTVAEQERRLEWRILKGAVENTNDAFVTIDANSTVIFFNKAAEEIFGYSREEVIGKDLALILGPACRHGHALAVARYVRTRQGRLIGHENQFTAMRRNGETFPAAISFSVAEVDGEPFFTGIVRDSSETRDLQERLDRGERLAALGQAVAEIVHEIKNPLVMIGGFTRQLRKNAGDEKEGAKLDLIATEVQRLEKLLAELRDLYAPRPPVFEEVDVAGLLEEVFALARSGGEGKRIRMELQLGEDRPVVHGDRERLKQVVLNVVKNGIEALEEDGGLTIELSGGEEQVEIIITDEGAGIPATLREKLFTPFFTTKSKGTGLGLCVSRRIVEEHAGGSIILESEEGRGTVARITLARHGRDKRSRSSG